MEKTPGNVVVVNGERYWQDFLPRCTVHYCQIQTAQWLVEGGRLFLIAPQGAIPVHGVLWRVGAIRPSPLHRAVLEMIRLAGVPCVNSAQGLLRGYDRLAMRVEMMEIGIPVVEQSIALGHGAVEAMAHSLPRVVKIGNYHGGFGKALVTDSSQMKDLNDVAFTANDYLTAEPFIDYVKDIRCLAIGGSIWAMERRGAGWKANCDTIAHNVVEAPEVLAGYTRAAMHHLKADILGLDFLEAPDGSYFLLETNDVPGLSGFPDALRRGLADCLLQKMAMVEGL